MAVADCADIRRAPICDELAPLELLDENLNSGRAHLHGGPLFIGFIVKLVVDALEHRFNMLHAFIEVVFSNVVNREVRFYFVKVVLERLHGLPKLPSEPPDAGEYGAKD
jgi:hypothetical protein